MTFDTTTILWIIAAVAAVVALVALFVWQGRNRSVKVFSSDGGTIDISVGALGSLIESTCLLVAVVSRARVQIIPHADKINLAVHLQVENHSHLRETLVAVQSYIRQTLENNLGMENLGQIDLRISHLQGDPVNQPLSLEGPVDGEPSEAFAETPYGITPSTDPSKQTGSPSKQPGSTT